MSPGNGHPYSWSAIINGYNKERMEMCEFEAIPRYLEKHNMDKEKIEGARISHIWTQDKDLTNKIAETTNIENKCKSMNEMLEEVDEVILARDDAEQHYKHAKNFIIHGVPIYIDKPIATNIKEAKKLFELQKYKGQIFTCSSLRYAPELNIDEHTKEKIGKIKKIRSTSPKDWSKYAVHLIEPSLCISKAAGKIKTYTKQIESKTNRLNVSYEDIELQFETTGKEERNIEFEIIGSKETLVRRLEDPFEAFKSSLVKFIESIKYKKEIIRESEVLEIVKIIELGM